MAGIFTGLIGSLVGIGIQAVLGSVRISNNGPTALDLIRAGGLPLQSENSFASKPTEQQKNQQPYDKIGQHVSGALQVLGPCVKVLNTLNTARANASANRAEASTVRQERLKYFGESTRSESADKRAPALMPHQIMRMKKSCTDCGCSRPTEKSGKPVVDKPYPMQRGQTDNSTAKTSQGKSISRGSSCQMCRVQLNGVNTPGLMPCGHIYCYSCLTSKNMSKCPQCGKIIDLGKIRGGY